MAHTFYLMLFMLFFFARPAAAQLITDWEASMPPGKVALECVDLDGKVAALPGTTQIGQSPAIVLDGHHALRLPCDLRNEQTYYLKMRTASTPGGIVLSRNRPEDGMRGIRVGLAGAKDGHYDGFRPAFFASAGDRQSLTSVFDAQQPELRPGRVYEWVVRFKPEELLRVDVIDSATREVVYSVQRTCPAVPSLAAKAGQGFLYCGGERRNSRQVDSPLPDGSAIMAIRIWSIALTDADLEALCGVRFPSAPAGKPGTAANRPGITYYLDAIQGDDQADGRSAEHAFRTFPWAAGKLASGDTLHILPGVYYGIAEIAQAGTAERPIRILGHPSAGRPVVITAADPALREKRVRWELVDESKKMYRTPFPHSPARILYSGTDLLPYPSVELLKKFQFLNDYPGNEHGFAYDSAERMLYVRLRGDGKYGPADPNAHVMAVSPPNAAGYNGHHIWKKEHANLLISTTAPAYVELSGLTFETPGAAAIITYGDQVTVRDVRFDGCRFGVWGAARKSGEKYPAGILLERCYYHHFPAFDDMVDMIVKYRNTPIAAKHKFFWWQRKGMQADREVMKNYETGIAGGIGRDWIVRKCRFENVFEGFSAWGNSDSVNLRIEDNDFIKVVDNAVEAENHAANLTICNNRFIDVFEPVSWQPLDGTPWPGPVFIYQNLFYQSPEVKDLWPWKPGAFKIGAVPRNWSSPRMGGLKKGELVGRYSKRFVAVPGEGFVAYNNTIYYPYGYFMTLPHATGGPEKCELVNFRFLNNLIWVETFAKESFTGSLMEFDHNIAWVSQPNATQSNLPAGVDGVMVRGAEELEFADPAAPDFALSKQSRWRARLMNPVALPGFSPLPGRNVSHSKGDRI